MRSIRALTTAFSLVFFVTQTLPAASLDPLAKGLSKGVATLKNKKVAVLAFPYHDGKISSGSTVVSERLTTQLVGKKGIRIIERHLIEQLLAEKKLNETGAIDAEDLKTIGTVLDADAVVTGTLIDWENGQTEINARMIRADSGEVLSAAREIILRTWSDSPILPRERALAVPASQEKSLSREEKMELGEIKKQENAATPKIPMKLSNESFPPSRRRYLSNDQPRKSNKKGYENSYDSYESDDGYYGYDNSANTKPTTSTKPKDPTFQSTLQHPTQLGTVTSQNEENPYSSYQYPKYPKYKPSKK